MEISHRKNLMYNFDDGSEGATQGGAASFTSPSWSYLQSGVGWRDGSRFIGDVVTFLVIFRNSNAAPIRPETLFVSKNRKVAQIEKQPFKFEWILSVVAKVYGEDDVVIEPVT